MFTKTPRQKSTSCDRWVFMYIPKCAGQWIKKIMRELNSSLGEEIFSGIDLHFFYRYEQGCGLDGGINYGELKKTFKKHKKDRLMLLRATGQFEVEGKEQDFTELQAYFRTFATREHAVMAIVPPSQLLLFANWPDHEIGMWYIFFKNTDLRRIEPGKLYFGSRPRPALRLSLEQEVLPETSPLDVWGGYRSGQPKIKKVKRTIYLSFDTAEERQRVLADLMADATEVEQHEGRRR